MSRAQLQLIGRSPAFTQAVSLIERIARFDAPVLIVGESGTGKEMAARAVHCLSSRRTAPFIPLNCGALPEALIESELYGYERGAFTDARQARDGLIAAAAGGTPFLDELDALPPRAQVSLLRFLQDRCYRPIGSQRERLGDVRIIAAASPRLRAMLDRGAFRDDLRQIAANARPAAGRAGSCGTRTPGWAALIPQPRSERRHTCGRDRNA